MIYQYLSCIILLWFHTQSLQFLKGFCWSMLIPCSFIYFHILSMSLSASVEHSAPFCRLFEPEKRTTEANLQVDCQLCAWWSFAEFKRLFDIVNISSILSDLEQTGNWSDETQQSIVYCQIFFQADPLLSVHQNVNKRRYVVWLALRVDLRTAYATAVSAYAGHMLRYLLTRSLRETALPCFSTKWTPDHSASLRTPIFRSQLDHSLSLRISLRTDLLFSNLLTHPYATQVLAYAKPLMTQLFLLM